MNTYSRDQQPASITLSVNYRLPADQVAKIYGEYGSEDGVVDRLIDRRVYEQVKNVFGQFNAVTAIQDRARLKAETEAAIGRLCAALSSSTAYRSRISISPTLMSNRSRTACWPRWKCRRSARNAEREKVQAQITVTQAQARADAVRAEAEANAAATRLAGEAGSRRHQGQGRALRDNPELINLTAAEKWNGQLPSTMVPGSACRSSASSNVECRL